VQSDCRANESCSLVDNARSFLLTIGIQQGGITSVCIDPREKTRVLTNCLASALHIIDVRAGKAIRTLRHDDFSTTHGHAGCTISPNGQFVAAGSDNGEVFVWDVAKGELKTRLASGGGGGVSPVIGIDWRESRDKESPQIASLDRKGAVVLWT
jgi:WD40 repeat protein